MCNFRPGSGNFLDLPWKSNGNKGKTMYLSSATNLKFFHKILPNSKFEIITNIKSFKRGIAICEGEGKVNNLTVCKAEFVLILPEVLKKYSISN